MQQFKFKYFMLSLSLLLGCAPFFNSCDEVENAFEASTIKGVYQNIGRVYDNIRTIRWLNLETNGNMTLVETLNGQRFTTKGKWIKLKDKETIKISCTDGDRKGETYIIDLTSVHYSEISFTFKGIDYTLNETHTSTMQKWMDSTLTPFDYSYLFGTWTATPSYGSNSTNWQTLQINSDYTFTLTTINGEQTQTTTGTIGVGNNGKYLDLFAIAGVYAGQTIQGNVNSGFTSSNMLLDIYNLTTNEDGIYTLNK